VITGTTKLFYMMAHPIAHVRSPEVFNPIFAARGIDAVMVPLHVHPDDFPAACAAMRTMRNLGGLIVSVPLKEAAFRLADVVDETAAMVGTANAVRRDGDGRLVAANFDGPGFMAGLLRNGEEAKGRNVLLVGAGGAGAAIAFSLAKAGTSSLRIADIDSGRAQRLAASVREHYPDLSVMAARADPTGCDVVVNATPAGLHPEVDPLPVDKTKLTANMLVADIIMKPATTPLLAAAQRAGCEVRYGAGMLDSQAEMIMTFFGYGLEA
jgi:shikimate dehydrogenase